MRGPDGAPLPSIGVWLWGGSPEGSKFTTTAWDGTFSFTHGDGTFTLIVYVIENDAYVGWYSEDSPGGFTTQRARATVFRLNGDRLTEVEIRLPADHVQLPPAMASSATAAVPVPDAKPDGARPATPTPTPTPTATPIPTYPEIVFMGEVLPASQAAYRSALDEVVAYYADRFGLQAPEFGVYIGADLEAARSVFAELTGGDPQRLRQGGLAFGATSGTKVLFIYGDYVNSGTANSLLLAHEYLHVLQRDLSGGYYKGTPGWLIEGAAIYESQVYYGSYERYRGTAIVRAGDYDHLFRNLQESAEWEAERSAGYAIGTLAIEWLISRAGADSHVEYWRLLTDSATWQDAFAAAFGMTVDEFHEAFEQHRNELVAGLDLGRIRGAVLGPGNEPVEGIGVWASAEAAINDRFEQTREDGKFDMLVLAGTFSVELHRSHDTPPFWRLVGWYGAGEGFTTDVGQAIFLDVADGDMVDIEMRLPANLADLPEARIPRVQGTVLGSDGEPTTGIGLWLWGGSERNSKFAGNSSDGTFEIPHQNGDFILRIYTLEERVWRQIGWYGGETGFTADFAQATEIEVDGADVTGIEIHLPAEPADLPTVP